MRLNPRNIELMIWRHRTRLSRTFALAVKELTINMSNMLEEQRRQGKDIEKLKAEPAERWSSMKRTVFNQMIGAGAAALAIGLIIMMAQYVVK